MAVAAKKAEEAQDTFTIAFFAAKNRSEVCGTAETTLEELAEVFAGADEHRDAADDGEAKEREQLWSPTRYLTLFEDGTGPEYRNRGYVAGCACVVVDLDEGTLSCEELKRICAPFDALAHTSTRSKPEHLKWRVIFRLSRLVSADEYDVIFADVEKTFAGHAVDQGAKDASRFHYFPSSYNGPVIVERFHGAPIDVDAILTSLPQRTKTEPIEMPEAVGARYVDGQPIPCEARQEVAELLGKAWPEKGRHTAQLALAGALRLMGWSPGEVLDFVCDVCRTAGDEDRPKREKTVADTFAQDEKITGWPTLSEHVDPETVKRARGLLIDRFYFNFSISEYLRNRREARINAPRVVSVTPHAYSLEFGKHGAPSGIEKLPLSDVADYLSGLTIAGWQGVFSFDVMRKAIVAERPPIRLDAETSEFSEKDLVRVAYWFAKVAMKQVSTDAIAKAVGPVAAMRETNALEEYFRSLPPSDGTAVEQLCDVLGAQGIERVFVRKFLLGAVRRVLRPGHQVDSALVLRSKPGRNKSSFVPALFGAAWTSESLDDLDEKKAGEKMQGRWAIELSELGYYQKDRNAFIRFITRREDTYRPAYGHGAATKFPRTCVFIATVNEREIYRDEEKADIRRLWVVDLGERTIDIAKVRALRDAVWSESYAATRNDRYDEHRLVSGPEHWLTDDEMKEHAERSRAYSQDEDPWTQSVRRYLQGLQRVTLNDVLTILFKNDVSKVSQKDSNRARRVLRSLSCVEQRRVMHEGVKQDVWNVPEELESVKPVTPHLRVVR